MSKMKDSGIEYVGNVPTSWGIKPIRAVFEEVTTKNKQGDVKTALKFTYGNIVLKDNFDADDDSYVADTILNYTVVEPGTIILNGLNLNFDFITQRIGLVKERGIITSAYMAFKPFDASYMFPEYAIYLLKSYDASKAFHNMGGGVRKILNFQEFKHHYVIVPSISEQHEIVSFLDRKCSEIDSLTSDIEEQIATLDQYKKSVITEAVTKGLDPNAEMKDSGVEWIGEIPSTWSIKKLKYILAEPMQYGATESGIDFDDNLPRYIRITDITENGTLRNDGKLSLSEDQAKKYILKDKTVLFARSGATVGKTFMYEKSYGRAAFAGYLISACVNENIAFPEWLLYFTQSFSYWEWVKRAFSQATIQNISADKYSNMQISIPPLKVQESIIVYLNCNCSEIDSIIASKQSQLDTLAEYKKSLIYEYVTGKKEVPSA